jgi:transposase
VEQRYQAVLEVFNGAPVTEVARRYGVARQTVHGWLRRYGSEGLSGLADRSSKPQTCPHQMPAVIEVRIVELRRAHPSWGPRTIGYQLGKEGVRPVPSRSAIYRSLVRHRLLDPKARRKRRSDYKRWERGRAMELWQMDVMGGVRLSDGTELKLVTGIDDHSRFCVSAKLVRRATAKPVCDALAVAMSTHGVPDQILTDNGKVFTGRFGPGKCGPSAPAGTGSRFPIRQPQGLGVRSRCLHSFPTQRTAGCLRQRTDGPGCRSLLSLAITETHRFSLALITRHPDLGAFRGPLMSEESFLDLRGRNHGGGPSCGVSSAVLLGVAFAESHTVAAYYTDLPLLPHSRDAYVAGRVTIAVASISTSRAGSRRSTPPTQELAGRIDPRTSTCARPTSRQSSMLLRNARVRTTSSSTASSSRRASSITPSTKRVCP